MKVEAFLPVVVALGCTAFVLALFPEAPLENRIAAILGLYVALIFAGPSWDKRP